MPGCTTYELSTHHLGLLSGSMVIVSFAVSLMYSITLISFSYLSKQTREVIQTAIAPNVRELQNLTLLLSDETTVLAPHLGFALNKLLVAGVFAVPCMSCVIFHNLL